MTAQTMLELAEANFKDAEEFCKGSFGSLVTDVSPYTKIVAELMQHATDRALRSPAIAGVEAREALEFYADPFAWKKKYDPDDVVRVPDFYSETSFGDTAIEALAALPPSQEVPAPPQRPADGLRLLADLFSESLHQTWTRGEIVNVIEDAIRLGSSHARPDTQSASSTPGK